MLAKPEPLPRFARPDLTWRRIHESPQITAITISRPTIVRTMLGPPALACELVAGEERFSGLASLPVLVAGVKAGAAGAQASTATPSTGIAAQRAARKSCGNLIIEGT